MTDEMRTAEQLLAAASAAGADEADVIVMRETSIGIGVSAAALEEAERSEGREAGLRVLLGKRQACVSGSDLSAPALEAMAARASASSAGRPCDATSPIERPSPAINSPDPTMLAAMIRPGPSFRKIPPNEVGGSWMSLLADVVGDTSVRTSSFCGG